MAQNCFSTKAIDNSFSPEWNHEVETLDADNGSGKCRVGNADKTLLQQMTSDAGTDGTTFMRASYDESASDSVASMMAGRGTMDMTDTPKEFYTDQ